MIFEGVKFSQKCQNSAKAAPLMLFLVFLAFFSENFLGERGRAGKKSKTSGSMDSETKNFDPQNTMNRQKFTVNHHKRPV